MRLILENLCRIQELDNIIKGLEEGLARVPAELAAAEAGVAAAEGELAAVREKRLALEKSRRALEQQVEDTGQAIKKHQRQVFEVKTNKEYTAMLHEIDGEKRRVSEMEERILSMMEEADSLAEAERQAAERACLVRRQAEGDRAELLAGAKRAEAEKAAAVADRDRALEGLPPEILAQYRRISRGRGGLAVVPMVGGACGGCFSNLPTRLTVEVHAMEEIITCEACGRILVWRPAEAAAEGKNPSGKTE